MATILHVEASPRGERSVSSSLAEEFLKLCAAAQPGSKTATLPLWDLALPEFDETAMNAKFKTAGGEALSPEEAEVWRKLKETFERFNAADKYVFSVPMWNFGIPYKLKHFIDVVTQPGLAFAYKAGVGFEGLLKNRKALLVATRGGAYAGMRGDPLDFQIKYMKSYLGFIGISDVKTVLVEGLNIGRREAAVAQARGKFASLAKTF